MVVLPELIRVYLVLLLVLSVWLVSDTDCLPAGNGGEELSEKVGGVLKDVILPKGDNGTLLPLFLEFEFSAQKIKPGEVVQPLELAQSPEHLPEKFLLIRVELLIEKRRALVHVPDGAAPSLVSSHFLSEFVLEGTDILLNHPDTDIAVSLSLHILQKLFRGVVVIGVGKQPVNHPVSLQCVLVDRHNLYGLWLTMQI